MTQVFKMGSIRTFSNLKGKLLQENGGVDSPAVCHLHRLPPLLPRLLWCPVLPEREGAARSKEGFDHHQPS